MAFSPKNSSVLLDVQSAISRDEALEIRLEKDKKKVQKEGAARIQAVQTVHALSTFGPILGYAVNASENEVEQAQWLLSTMKQAHLFAHQVFSELNLSDEDVWAKAIFEKVFIDAWVETQKAPSLNLIRLSIEALRRQEISGLLTSVDSVEMPSTSKLELQLQIAWFEAMATVARIQQKFDFFRSSPEQDLIEGGEKLWKFAIEAMGLLLDEHAVPQDRAAVLESLMREGGKALASSWQMEAEKAQNALQQKSKTEINAWKKANPQGFPLTTVWSRFEQQTRRLLLLSRQAPSARGKTQKTH